MGNEEEEAKSSEHPKASEETAMANVSTTAPAPSWFTPKRLLVIFCVINLVNYVDRGTIASNGVNGSSGTCTKSGTCTSGSGIQGEFNLNNFQDGVLSSAFMVGLLVASPVFASLAKSVNPFRLIGVGLSVWTVAVVGCGLSFDFWSITICRMLVGVGEASFISLAAPFIDDNAPVEQKTAWLAIFYMCIPTGYAIGYIYGGVVGSHMNWRYAFWGEAIIMFPFAVLGFIMKPLQLKGFAPADSKRALTAVDAAVSEVEGTKIQNLSRMTCILKGILVGKFLHAYPLKDMAVLDEFRTEFPGWENYWDALPVEEAFKDNITHKPSKLPIATRIKNQVSRFMKDMRVLLVEKVYVINVLGYIAYNFVIGAYSYWGPKAGYNIYHMEDADMIFGGITVVCGILGTLAGGFVLDFMTNSIPNAFKLLSATTFVGAAFCFSAFCFKSMYAFLALFAIGELFVFATQGPVNFICLHCVKPSLRPLSMAISTVSIHIFGDVPSSPLVGVLQDSINNWRTTALILTSILFPAAAIWFIGIFLKSKDRFNEDSEHHVSTTTERSNTAPLLRGKPVEAEASAEPC